MPNIACLFFNVKEGKQNQALEELTSDEVSIYRAFCAKHQYFAIIRADTIEKVKEYIENIKAKEYVIKPVNPFIGTRAKPN